MILYISAAFSLVAYSLTETTSSPGGLAVYQDPAGVAGFVGDGPALDNPADFQVFIQSHIDFLSDSTEKVKRQANKKPARVQSKTITSQSRPSVPCRP